METFQSLIYLWHSSMVVWLERTIYYFIDIFYICIASFIYVTWLLQNGHTLSGNALVFNSMGIHSTTIGSLSKGCEFFPYFHTQEAFPSPKMLYRYDISGNITKLVSPCSAYWSAKGYNHPWWRSLLVDRVIEIVEEAKREENGGKKRRGKDWSWEKGLAFLPSFHYNWSPYCNNS